MCGWSGGGWSIEDIVVIWEMQGHKKRIEDRVRRHNFSKKTGNELRERDRMADRRKCFIEE